MRGGGWTDGTEVRRREVRAQVADTADGWAAEGDVLPVMVVAADPGGQAWVCCPCGFHGRA